MSTQEPLFWYRPCSNGLYEGPLHNAQIEEVRKRSGAWVPLFAQSPTERGCGMSHRTPYEYRIGSDGKHCVDGPGNGFGYYAGTLWPNLRLSNEVDARAAAELCNTAWAEGYEAARRDIRRALGVTK